MASNSSAVKICGTLSPDEFASGLRLFVEKSSILGDSWILTDDENSDTDTVYIKKTCVLPVFVPNANCESVRQNTEPGTASLIADSDNMYDVDTDTDTGNTQNQLDIIELECDDCLADESVINQSDSMVSEKAIPQEYCNYEYHVVYSSSYQVPVLYFNVNRQNGTLLPLDTIWQQVPRYYQERLKHERWTFITQQEHPVLARPFYQLHPCYTDKFMTSVKSMRTGLGDKKMTSGAKESFKYLVVWLSVVALWSGLSFLYRWE